MEHEGPPLELLMRRLLETPREFLAEPMVGSLGEIDVGAVLWDTLRHRGQDALTLGIVPAEWRPRSLKKSQRNSLRLILLVCWLLADDAFASVPAQYRGVVTMVEETIPDLDVLWPADALLADPDRREELIRRLLDRMNLRPQGETWEQAIDRLLTLDSLERSKALVEAEATERRNQAIREAMARKAAQEAAARYGE
ncbi:hypothetical protein [Tuwongella immobilis]|uniref:Uncharacterized protein n=1 Tax=Tuwongella immobilis TaxID=692036 RepID=A0A6C2YJQ9_9BACT|nr:hypothetical protein [Tuwongella immobilis]VIP01604.1 Uncharacterized protein OS=Janthinobacterium sp. HH01 GN=Jab_2c18320 PE=4 SV=1 [Tuwongella immobilis]VTR98901.1 Uncharacterized protein OS=Janthinobacterium sp. HH01 GN=Jab_2c18320 PE=4 SV=1 [Tuwongella immobilis]